MAVAVGSTSSLAFGVRTVSTVTAPASIANGDLLLAFVFAGDFTFDQEGPDVTPPAGWADVSSPHSLILASDPNYGAYLSVFWKIASGESGSYSFTHLSADSQVFMYRITGADTTAPFTPAGTTNTNYNNTPAGVGKLATALGLTTAANDSLVIYAVALWDGGPGTPPTGSTPTFTERLDSGAMYIADGVLATAGATGDKVNASAFTAQATTSVWRALLVAVQPPVTPVSVTVNSTGSAMAITAGNVSVTTSGGGGGESPGISVGRSSLVSMGRWMGN